MILYVNILKLKKEKLNGREERSEVKWRGRIAALWLCGYILSKLPTDVALCSASQHKQTI